MGLLSNLNDFHEILNLTRTKYVSGRDDAWILNFGLCLQIAEIRKASGANMSEKIDEKKWRKWQRIDEWNKEN